MSPKSALVSRQRKYLVQTVGEAKAIAAGWLESKALQEPIAFGLPEIDDRYHIWRVPLVRKGGHAERLGELVIDAYTTEVIDERSTRPRILESRLLGKADNQVGHRRSSRPKPVLSALRNTVGLGDAAQLLEEMPAESVDLVFTSPPYYNARPEYSEYTEYDEYLFKMRQVLRRCHRVLSEGRFLVVNVSPVLVRRASRNQASRRIAVPFDIHSIMIDEGFDFIDDIIWLKPEGAGWATGRGRRFAADRNPLQYKAVPVTEYVLVYRKRTTHLIDWHIRNHPDSALVEASKIDDGYERTNVWRIHPRTNGAHPAAFPFELAEKVIRYYSFKHDVVLDPFAGSGTVGAAAAALDRRFVLFDIREEYIDQIRANVHTWLGPSADEVLWVNTNGPSSGQSLI